LVAVSFVFAVLAATGGGAWLFRIAFLIGVILTIVTNGGAVEAALLVNLLDQV